MKADVLKFAGCYFAVGCLGSAEPGDKNIHGRYFRAVYNNLRASHAVLHHMHAGALLTTGALVPLVSGFQGPLDEGPVVQCLVADVLAGELQDSLRTGLGCPAARRVS